MTVNHAGAKRNQTGRNAGFPKRKSPLNCEGVATEGTEDTEEIQAGFHAT